MPPVKNRKKKKNPANNLPDLPKRGDCFLFRYYNHPTFCHTVYEEFPCGVQVKPDHCYVDFSKPIYVEEVRQAEINGNKYVAVSFMMADFFGVELWRNYSKGEVKWLVKFDDCVISSGSR